MKSIALIGCGATGHEVAIRLAQYLTIHNNVAGPDLEVTVYDYDIVEIHNLGKLNLPESAIFNPKAQAICDNVNYFYNLHWRASATKYNGQSHDLMISCVDSVDARKFIIESYKKNNSHALIDFGNGADFGQILIANSEDSKKPLLFTDMFPDAEDDPNAISCTHEESLDKQNFMINMTMAIAGMPLIIDTLQGKAKYNYCSVNLKNEKPIVYGLLAD